MSIIVQEHFVKFIHGKTVMQYMDEKYDMTESHSYEYVKGDKYETLKRYTIN